jgi:thiamine kinase-like enzyme
VRDNGFALPAGYADHDPAFQRIRRALAVHDEGTVPCNNDLLAANFVDDGVRIRLIDYEYAGNNDACFELGNTVQECLFDRDRTEALVAAYFGEVTREKLARVRLQAVVAQYGWSLWGCIQHAASTLDFDFWGWGVERYEGAVAVLAGPDLETLLDDAAATR